MKFTGYFLTAISFIIIAFFVVSYAAGYKIDLVNRKIKQTAMLDVQTKTKDSKIFLNGEEQGTGSAIIRDLEPGTYEVKVSKDGYHEWSKTISLAPGQAETLNDVSLFLLEPVSEEFKDELNTSSISKLADTDNLYSNGGEIYENNLLVTRLSTDIFGLSWYPDRRYIAFTTNDKLNIIEIDGTNRIELLDKKSDSSVVFVNSGVSVIYENDGKIYRATIR